MIRSRPFALILVQVIADCAVEDCAPEALELRQKLGALVLSNDAVWAREKQQ